MNKKTDFSNMLDFTEIALISQRSDELMEIVERITKSPPETFKELEAFRRELFAWGQEVNDLRGFIEYVEKNFNKTD